MYGRAPKFREENALSLELKNAFNNGERDILKPPRLIQLFAGRTTPVSGQITIWTPHEFSYPSIIKPIQQLSPSNALQTTGKLFAFLGEPPDSLTGGVQALESRNGLLKIPIPAQWWIGYDGIVDRSIYAFVFDNTCGAAEHLLGVRNVILMEPGVVSVLTANAVDIVGDNQYRDGVYLQNQGTVDVWVRRGTAAEFPAAVGTGYKVPPGETYPLIGNLAYKGPLNGRADGVNANVWPTEVYS